MKTAPSFDDIFAAMSAASVGDLTARVALPDDPRLDDVPTRFALALNVLLDDLSFRVSAADRMRESYRSTFESSAQPMYVLDLATLEFLEVNDAAVQQYGYTREELLKMTAEDLWPAEDAEKNREVASQALPLLGVLMRHRKKDGSLCWVEARVNAMTFDGRASRLVVINDVTRALAAEEARKAAEARFARLADSGILGIVTSDLNGTVLEANDAYLRMLGYSRDELARGLVRWNDLTPPEFVHLGERAGKQLEESGVAPPWETETFCKDRSRLPILVGVAMLEYPKSIAFLVDLSERRRAEAGRQRAEEALHQSEEQLRQAQKMEAVGRLAGGVAHDFNNVLSVIMGYGDLLMEDLRPGDPMRAEVEEIRKAGARAAGLTKQLLMFSRQQVIAPRVIDLHEVLTSMDNMLQRILGEDVELVSLPPKAAGRVKADPTHIEQVILNLVVNARDAMPTGGKLTLETANVVLDEQYARTHLPAKAGPYVMLAVSDTGVGMDRETQERIFEPFFTTKEVGKGTGLGLSTVFGIVQQSGGNIWVYSEPGKGTTFKVYLPRVDADVDAAKPHLAPATLRGTETILLVEDEEQVRTVVANILRRQGYRVFPAQHAGEALLLCEGHPEAIDLLITDVVMPQMSGPELAKRLAQTRPGMKVLCMSGYTDDSIVRHGVLESGVAFLQKPVTPATLATKVREILDGDGLAK